MLTQLEHNFDDNSGILAIKEYTRDEKLSREKFA